MSNYPYIDPSDPRASRARGEDDQTYANRMEGLNAFYRNRLGGGNQGGGQAQPVQMQPKQAHPRPESVPYGGLYDYIARAMGGR